MAEAIGGMLPFAVGVAISPVPIIGVILMLATPQGRTNGLAFLLGWIGGLAIVGTIVLVVSSGADASSGGAPANWTNVLKLVLGLLLLLVALRQWRRRPLPGEEPEMPSWMKSIDRFTAGRSAAFGVVLSSINPKNLLLTVGGAAAIAQTGATTGSQAVALALFVIIASIGTGAPVAIYLLMRERSAEMLERMREWMAAHNAAIMTVLCLLIGVKLLGDAISGFGS